ncbi:MAG: bifunctional nicotinamidase/pyrazinamidase [Bacteroidales bacterium]
MKTLIIVDVQNDFMPGGPLAVPHGDLIVPVINKIQRYFDLIVATQDWHPKNHKSFASNHFDKKPFNRIILNGIQQTLWPDHCIQGSAGAELHRDIESDRIAAIFRKGMDPEVDSYSGFYDNNRKLSTGLTGYLKEKGVSEVYFCGLAADICVYYTILDSISEGFTSTLIEDASRPLYVEKFDDIKCELAKLGVHIITSDELAGN